MDGNHYNQMPQQKKTGLIVVVIVLALALIGVSIFAVVKMNDKNDMEETQTTEVSTENAMINLPLLFLITLRGWFFFDLRF